MNKHQVLTKNLVTLLQDAVRKHRASWQQVLDQNAEVYSVSFLLIGGIRITDINPLQDVEIQLQMGRDDINDAIDDGIESHLRYSFSRVWGTHGLDFCANGLSRVYDGHDFHNLNAIVKGSDIVALREDIEGLLKRYVDEFRNLGPANDPPQGNTMKAFPPEKKTR